MKATFFAGVLRRLSIAAVLCTALAPVPSIATPQNLYVSDAFRILEITPTGTQTTFAEKGLNNPRGLAFDNAGNLFVATTPGSGVAKGTLLRFNPAGSGTTVGTVPDNTFLEGVATNIGNVFVMALDTTQLPSPGTIYKFSSGGGPPNPFGSVPGQGFGLEFDDAGNLFAADFSDGAIFQFSANGTRTLFATVGTTFPNGGITGPIDLAFDNSGNLFVTIGPSFGAPPNTPGEIIEITPQGVQTVFATGLPSEIFGLAFDMSGNLFASFRGGPIALAQILEFTPEGVESVFASDLVSPTFLTFGPPSQTGVPDGGTTFMLLGTAIASLGFFRRTCAASLADPSAATSR